MGEVLRTGAMAAVSASGTSAKAQELGVVPTFEGTETIVQRITVVSPTTQAAQGATNFAQLQVRKSTNAGTPVVIATYDLGANGLTADTPVNLTLTTKAVSNGDLLDVYVVQTGTGGAVPAGTEVQVELG